MRKNINVYQMINDRNNPAANQIIIEVGNNIFFQSYSTMIAKYDKDKVYATDDWDYSKTTAKHFYIFLRDYCGKCSVRCKEDVKWMIENGEIEIVDKIEL